MTKFPIGEIRAMLFVNRKDPWNAIVRDWTAELELLWCKRFQPPSSEDKKKESCHCGCHDRRGIFCCPDMELLPAQYVNHTGECAHRAAPDKIWTDEPFTHLDSCSCEECVKPPQAAAKSSPSAPPIDRCEFHMKYPEGKMNFPCGCKPAPDQVAPLAQEVEGKIKELYLNYRTAVDMRFGESVRSPWKFEDELRSLVELARRTTK